MQQRKVKMQTIPILSGTDLQHGRQASPSGDHADVLLDVGLVGVLWDGALHLQNIMLLQ